MTLKEQLQARSASSQKTIQLESAPGIDVTIRRITLAERNAIMAKFDKVGLSEIERGVQFSIALLSVAVVPPIPEEDALLMDAQVADELVLALNEFNGWTKKGRTEATDQFRPTA